MEGFFRIVSPACLFMHAEQQFPAGTIPLGSWEDMVTTSHGILVAIVLALIAMMPEKFFNAEWGAVQWDKELFIVVFLFIWAGAFLLSRRWREAVRGRLLDCFAVFSGFVVLSLLMSAINLGMVVFVVVGAILIGIALHLARNL